MQKLSVCLALSGASGFVLPSPQLRLQRRALEAEGVGPLRRQRLYPPSALRSDAGRTVEENSEGAAERAHLEAMMDSADLSKHLEDELKGMPMEEKKMLKSIGLDLPDVETAADHDGQFVFDPSLLDKPLEELEEMIEESSKSRAAMEEMEVFAKKMKEAGGGGKAKKSERDMEDEEKEEKLQSEAIEKLLRSRGLDMDQMSSSIDDFFREAEVQSSSGRPKETAPETPPTPSPSAEKREGRIEETVGDLIIVEDPEPKGAVFGIGKRKGKKGKLRKLGEGEGEGQGKTSSEKGELELGKENFSDVGKGLGKKSFTDVGKGVGKESFSDVGKGIGKESFSEFGKEVGKESFSDVGKGIGKESFSDVGKGIGKESFSDVGKGIGKESFSDVGKGHGKERFSDVGKGIGKESFSDVGKGIGKESFSDVGKGIGKESFSDVGKGIGKESFSDVGKGIGKESFSDVGKGIGKESFSDVGKGIGKESFSDVGKGIGKESFSDVGKGIGKESFSDVGKGIGKKSFSDVGKGIGKESFSDVGKGIGKESFSDVGKGIGKESFSDFEKEVGKESFSDVGKGIGKESFSDVGKGIGKESFSDFEKEVGKESFSDVGQGIGKESFSDVGKEVGKESFTDVGKALGIESFVEAKAQEGGRRKSLFKPPVSPSSSASAETEGEVDASEASPASSSPSPSTASSSSGRRRRRGFGSAVEVEGTEGKEKGQSEKERASQRKLSEKIPSLEGGLLPPSAVKRAASLEGGLVFPSGGSKEKKETKFSEKKEGEEGEKKTSKERENPKDLREAVKEFQKKKDEMEAKAGKKMDPATQLQLAIDTGLVERRDPERERMIRERMKKRLRKERLEKASIEPMEVMEQLGQPQTQGMKEELEMLEEMELEMEDQARAIRKRKLQKEGKIDVELEQDKVFGEYDEEDLDQIERSLEKAKARRDQRQNEGDADDNTLATEAYIDFSPLPEAKLEEIDFSMMTDDELSAFQSIAAVEFGKPVEIGRRMAGGKTMKLPSEIAVEYCQLADPFTSLVDFERFIQYSEYQEALKDGQLTMEDLKEAWDAVEKVKKNRVDLKGFKLAWKYIDGLFEDAEEEGDAGEEEEESAEEKAVSEDAAGEAEEEEDGDQWEEVEVEEDEDEDAEEEEADLNFLKSRTEQRIANLLRVADSSGRIPGDYPGDTYILGELISDEWQMDLYSRSVRVGGPKGKKLWELLITDQTGNFRHIEQIDGRQVNSRTVCEAIIRVMQRSPVKPVLVRFFRDQMQTMLTIAIEGAELRVRASRSCWTLNDWLKEREDKVYPKMEGYDPTLKTLYTPFVFPPDPAPKDMKVAAYGLGMLQLKELLALANQVDNFIGCQLPPQLDTKDGDVSIPGIVFYTGYKTTQFSQAMLSREIAFVKANLADRAIRIEANIYTTYDMAGIADKTLPYAARFENGKLAAQGLHYVAVAASAVERPVSLWLLRETALEEIALRRGVREELETGMMTELDTEATKEASVL
uniref:Uncharacterized protein n=1 Tax=Chromera velia CCMP2878 TaxID=1169474 RepID=A0A0G4FIV6_9ALVE